MEPILRAATGTAEKAGSEYGVEAYNLYLAIGRITELGIVLKTWIWVCSTSRTSAKAESSSSAGTHPKRVEYWHDLDAGYAGRQPL